MINPTTIFVFSIIGLIAVILWSVDAISFLMVSFDLRKKRCYIAGAVSGRDLRDIDKKFRQAELEVRKMGFVPVNPRRLIHIHRRRWIDYMRIDLRAMTYCHAVYALECWAESPGANIEVAAANSLGLNVIFQSKFRSELREKGERVPLQN